MLHLAISLVCHLPKIKLKCLFPAFTRLSKHEPFKSIAHDISSFIADYWVLLLWIGILLFLVCAIFEIIGTIAYLRNDTDNRKEYVSAKRELLVVSTIFATWLIGGFFVFSSKSDPQITISSLWVEHDVTQDDRKGCLVHLDCEVEGIEDGALKVFSNLYNAKGSFDASIFHKDTKRGERIISSTKEISKKDIVIQGLDKSRYVDVTVFHPYSSTQFLEGNHVYYVQCNVRYANSNDSTEAHQYCKFNYNKPIAKKITSRKKSSYNSNTLYGYYGGAYNYYYGGTGASPLEESSSVNSYSKCHDCHGSTNCRHCNGSGRSILTGYSEMCVVCKGSGRCKQCFGTGRI